MDTEEQPPRSSSGAPFDSSARHWLYRPITWLILFLVAGASVRLERYLLGFPLWHDEMMLVANFVEKDHLGLLGLLERKQVAPPAFLLAERWIIDGLGFSEASLRLLPLLAGLISLPLVARIAWLVLVTDDDSAPERPLSHTRSASPREDQRWTAALTVGLFAAAYFPIRYSCEVKPYSLDLATSAMLVWLALEWFRTPTHCRWPLALILLTPLSLSLSFTAVLAAGGVAVTLAIWAIRSPSVLRLSMVGGFGLTIAASFLVLRFFTTQPGQAALNGELTQYWANNFPPQTLGPDLWLWLIRTHTSELFAYPVGGQNGASALTSLCLSVGAIHLLRIRRWQPVVMFSVMLGLLFVAAWLRKYPYGGHTRLVLFIAPLVCLFAAVGIQAVLARLETRRALFGRGMLLATLLVTLGLTAARDLVHPFKSGVDARHRTFARAFWQTPPVAGWKTVALSRHRSQCSAPQLCDFAYRVEQALSLREPLPSMGRLIPEELHQTPLRCIVYQNATAPRHEGDYQVWRRAIAETHTVVAIDQYALPVLNDHLDDLYEVYWLVPNGQPVDGHPVSGTISGVTPRTSPITPPLPVRIAAVEGRRL